MTIASAAKFIAQAQTDTALRKAMNSADHPADLNERLTAHGFTFSSAEFEEAYNAQLVSCQFLEQAEQLQEFKMWWSLLHQLLGAEASPSDAGCRLSATCGSSGSCKSCGV